MALVKEQGRMVIRFELSLFGLFGLIVIAACIFFWMFIIGIWAGQTVLQPPPGEGRTSLARIAESMHPQPAQSPASGGQMGQAAPGRAGLEKDSPAADSQTGQGTPQGNESAWTATEPSFFVVQVAALREQERAQQELAQWRGKGYEAFLVLPEDKDDQFIRVFVGKFDNLAEANKLSARLEKAEKVKGYISLLPATRLKNR